MYVCDDIVYFLYYNSIVKYYIQTNESEIVNITESNLLQSTNTTLLALKSLRVFDNKFVYWR